MNNTMTWKVYLNKIAAVLAEHLEKDVQYSSMPKTHIRQIAWREIELFVENFKKWPPEKLILKESSSITTEDRVKLGNFIRKRQEGIPLAYIIGKQRFYGLDFKVNKNVLIPRPETEELVEYVLGNVPGNVDGYLPSRQAGVTAKNVLIDIGAGSGCILAAVLKNISPNINFAKIYAVDSSLKALQTARENIKKHLGTNYKIEFIQGSLLNSLGRNALRCVPTRYTIIANLPYLSESEYEKLSPEVKNNEPKSALVGGKSGHELIRKLINQIITKNIHCDLLLEISPAIYPKIKKYLARQDITVKIKIKRDLSGKIRIMHLIF